MTICCDIKIKQHNKKPRNEIIYVYFGLILCEVKEIITM